MTTFRTSTRNARPGARQAACPRPGSARWSHQALASEANDLLFLAERIEACAIRPVPGLDDWKAQVTALLSRATFGALGSEHALDRLARDLRTLWLRYAQGAADGYLRSPTASQQPAVTGAGTCMTYGYERELEPTALEARCAGADESLPGWAATHLLFSSGQATLTAAIQASLQMHAQSHPAGHSAPLRLLHLGSYFETRALLELFEASQVVHTGIGADGPDAALGRLGACDVLLAEVVYCEGALKVLDLAAFARAWRNSPARPSLVVFDTTLSGPRFPLERLLGLMAGPSAPAVLCLRSALKLDQAGLELANAGLCSIYVPKGAGAAAAALPETLRRIRRLTGSSLGLQDMAALEAPWFLDPLYRARYCDAILANNRQLALRFAPKGGLFAGLSHPALAGSDEPWAEAPFCTLLLNEPSPENYRRLARLIEAEERARNLAFDPGGSFGFRGHRFDAILPDQPDAPCFLRVAIGARNGPSLAGIIRLLNDLAACNTLEDIRPTRTGRPGLINA